MDRISDDSGPTPVTEPIPAPRQEAEDAEVSGDAADDVPPRQISSTAVEFIAVLVLSVTTILTAWSAFQASKWSGAMSIAFSQASSARIEASRLDETGNVRISNHIGLWTQWVAAEGTGDTGLAEFLVERFPEPLATAHQDWLAAGGATEGAPGSPFEMPSYVIPEKREAAASDARADERFETALANNQRSDDYTILTVLFAVVLFFTAMSGRVRAHRSQLVLLGAALVLGVIGLFFLVIFPKLV